MRTNTKLFRFSLPLVLIVSALLILAATIGGLMMPRVSVLAANVPEQDYALVYCSYTVIEGDSAIVTDPRGETVAVKDGKFTPMKAGDYLIRTAQSARTLTVFSSVPVSDYRLNGTLDEIYATNQPILLPKAKVTSAIEKDAVYEIFIEREGSVIQRFTKNEVAVFAPSSAGEYGITYTYVDYFGYISNKTLEISVVDQPVLGTLPPSSIGYGKSVRLETVYAYCGAEKVEAVLEVRDPDGVKLDTASGSFVADKRGKYTYAYTAVVGGATVSETFEVYCDLYGRDLFDPIKLAKAPVSGVVLPDNCNQTGSGVLLEATATGATFRFQNMIDLNAMTRDQNLLTFLPYVTDSIGYTDTIEVILTDAYDPYNKISIQFKRSPFHDNLTYVTGAHNGRHYAFDNENWVLTGVNGPVKIGDKYFYGGIMRNHYSMTGVSTLGLNLYSFAIDYANRDLVLDLTSEGEGRYTLVDFDNPVWLGGSQHTWNGFTTGEAYLSIEFGGITGKSAGIIVTEVMGQSVQDNVVTDDVAPVIMIDTEMEYLTDMPYGIIGKPYPIPTASARDTVSGVTDVTTSVHYQGNPFQSDGASFTADKAGVYEIVYTATDISGNTVTKTLTVDILAAAKDIIPTLDQYEAPKTDQYFKVPSVTVAGASGNFVVDTKVFINGAEVVPDDAGKVYIDKVGNIEISVTVTDFLERSIKKTFTIPVGDELPRMSVPFRPMTASSGSTLTFLAAELTDFLDSDTAEVVQKIFVNGTQLDGFDYIVKSTDRTLEVRYETTVNGTILSETFTVTVTESGGSLEEIFETDGAFAVGGVNNDEVHFLFEKDGTATLKNPVSHNLLKVSASAPVYGFESLDMCFEDYNNPDIAVFLRVTDFSTTLVRIQLNGTGDFVYLNGSLSSKVPFTFFYNSDKRVFQTAVSEKVLFEIGHCLNGDVFRGFTSGAVKVGFRVNGVKNVSTVRLAAISNEAFVTYLLTDRDSVPPVIGTATEREEFTLSIGSVYETGIVRAYDVIQGMSDVTASVYAPDGSLIHNGVKLTENLRMHLDRYGEYTLVYEAENHNSPMKAIKVVYLYVRDAEAPVIAMQGEIASQAALGEFFTLPTATATDNVTENPVVRVLVYDPDAKNMFVQPGASYRFVKLGTHKIVYWAQDDAGNDMKLQFIVEVR